MVTTTQAPTHNITATASGEEDNNGDMNDPGNTEGVADSSHPTIINNSENMEVDYVEVLCDYLSHQCEVEQGNSSANNAHSSPRRERQQDSYSPLPFADTNASWISPRPVPAVSPADAPAGFVAPNLSSRVAAALPPMPCLNAPQQPLVGCAFWDNELDTSSFIPRVAAASLPRQQHHSGQVGNNYYAAGTEAMGTLLPFASVVSPQPSARGLVAGVPSNELGSPLVPHNIVFQTTQRGKADTRMAVSNSRFKRLW